MDMRFSVSSFAGPLVSQRRFRLLLIGLVLFSLMLGLVIVPVEQMADRPFIKTWSDGIWWSVITVTGVGYGDVVPVTPIGRVLGMVVAVVGVLAYGLMIAMFGLALEETRDRYYRMKMFEKLDDIDERIHHLEKNNEYLVKKESDSQGER